MFSTSRVNTSNNQEISVVTNMISHENKCIYVHIPKAAGTSLCNIFRDEKKKEWDPFPFSPDTPADLKFDPPPPHFRAQDHVKYGHATQEQFDSYFKFTFTRNPWDRIVSEYKYRGYVRRYPFKEFLFKHLPRRSWSDLYCHLIPQYDFVFDENGNQVLDFVGKLENLQADYEHVCKILSIPIQPLPRDNKSLSIFRRRDNNLMTMLRTFRDLVSINRRRNTFSKYTEYYDKESIDFVAQLYKNDIEKFGYDFGQ